MADQFCPKCSKRMTLLSKERKRYYCTADNVVFFGLENRWGSLSDDMKGQFDKAKQNAKLVGVIGIVLIVALLFVIPLEIYPIVCVVTLIIVKFVVSSMYPAQLKEASADELDHGTASPT
jgi:hypothetical protein